MKPIKPKKMPKALERIMRVVADADGAMALNGREVKAILAALEYERQRADKAEADLRAVPPQHRNGPAAIIMREMMGPPEKESK